jgi:hypothetical protein
MKFAEIRSPHTNPVAVAMKARYGRTTGGHKHRGTPRGGQRNEMADFLAELDEEREEAPEARTEAQDGPVLMTDGDEWLLKRSDACP